MLTIAIENGDAVTVNLAPLLSDLQSDLADAEAEITALKNKDTDLQAQITALMSRMDDVEDCSGCGGTLNVNGFATNTSAKKLSPILYQNNPNPYETITNIKYYLPVSVNSAYLSFTDLSGREISTFNLSKTSKGEHTIQINRDTLASGMYFYALFINGKKIDAKKMIVK